jgi:hypothetical protein
MKGIGPAVEPIATDAFNDGILVYRKEQFISIGITTWIQAEGASQSPRQT